MIVNGDVRGFGDAEETRAAMAIAPDYWLRWYSVKSIALVLTFGALTYMIGRERGRRSTR